MATAAVLPSPSSPTPALDGCRPWWKCSAGSVPKLVDVLIPAAPSAPAAPATPEPSPTEEEECAEEIVDDEEEEDDDFELDELTERALDAEEAYYAAASHKAPRMRKNDRFPQPRPKADHSRHALRRDSASARHCADAIVSLPTETLLIDALFNYWDEDEAAYRLDDGVRDYARPFARLRERRLIIDQLYIRKWRLRELRRDRSHPPSCRICLEDFGWRPIQTRKRVATLSYADVLRIPRDPRKLVYTARHTLCDNSRCAICVECFKRDVELQMSKPRFLFSNRGIMNRSIGINCQGCNVRWSNDEWEQRHIISKILTPAQLDLLSVRIMEAYLRTSPDIVACPGANCTALISVHPDSKCTCISCPACPLYFCYVCKVPYHFGRTCAEYLKDDPAAAWRAANTKPCPQCHTPIEKNGGCSHMHCALCNLDFTWTEHKFGVYLPPAAAARITLRRVRKGPPADFVAFSARHAKERLGADDDDAAAMLAEAEDEEEAAREAEAFERDFDERTPDVVLIATRRRKNPSHTAHARNERHAAARVTRRLADRFPEIFPLARLAVAAA